MVDKSSNGTAVLGKCGACVWGDYLFVAEICVQGGPKCWPFWKFITAVYDDIGRLSTYKNVQIFGVLNVAVFKYFYITRETILHRKYQLI